MGKLIAWLVAGVVVFGLAGYFPHVAVSVTAIVIVLIFVGAKYFGE